MFSKTLFLNLLNTNNFFNCNSHKRYRHIRLRLELSQLREKFKFIFRIRLEPFCSRGSDIELTSYFLLDCFIFNDIRHNRNTLNNTDCKVLDLINSSLKQTVLFVRASFDIKTKTLIFNATIDYFYPLKESSNFFSTECFFICNHLIHLMLDLSQKT